MSYRCALGLVGFASLCASAAHAQVFSESFESGLGLWTVDSYVGGALPWNPLVVSSTTQAHSGARSLRFSADGFNDDGTLWVERTLSLAPGQYTISLSFWMWSQVQSDFNNWQVVGYLGLADPQTELQFLPPLGQTNQAAGWAPYSLTRQFTLAAPTTVWAGFGFNIVYEVSRVYYFDDATITIVPAPAALAPFALAAAGLLRRRRAGPASAAGSRRVS